APVLSQRFEVRAVPTLMVVRNGEVVARQPGAVPLPQLRSWLDAALAAPAGGHPTTEESAS
ncbi:co-chaperone YbbN, partial [Pseudonocardia sp.]|uniref:thioredoxin family protein n=1 Tax=Pseudonocardia sp. TaxID=60912 RepID=UPI0026352E15